MKRGAVLFAYNNDITDYYKMAAYTASRIERFLNIPVTVITDADSISCDYQFDQVIVRTPDTSNARKGTVWINKGRYEVFDLSPYDDTLVLDTDYLVNSDKLNLLFKSDSDFLCHRDCRFLLNDAGQETIGIHGPQTYWATVMRFTKTTRTRELFSMVEMVQKNYDHYRKIYNVTSGMYRNDYAVTLALRTVNGQVENKSDSIPWKLLHVPSTDTTVTREDDTVYRISKHGEGRQTHIIVKNTDFHMINKQNFMEIAV